MIDSAYRLNADEKRREQIRMREKAAFDYGNDMAVARDEGIAIGEARGRAQGRAETYSEVVEKLRRGGMTDEQIRFFLGNDYQN